MDWLGILTSIAVAAGTALVTWGLGILTAWLNSKIKNDKVKQYMNDALSIVDSAVKSTYQTYVQALKEQGKFDMEAQKVALEKAKNTILSQLSSGAQDYLKGVFGDIDEWMNTQIESRLYELKNGGTLEIVGGQVVADAA